LALHLALDPSPPDRFLGDEDPALIIEACPVVVSIAGNALDQIAIGLEDLYIPADNRTRLA
jgi:hypothetical protein